MKHNVVRTTTNIINVPTIVMRTTTITTTTTMIGTKTIGIKITTAITITTIIIAVVLAMFQGGTSKTQRVL